MALNPNLIHPGQHLVLAGNDVVLITAKFDAAIRAVLEAFRMFPGARTVH